MREKEKERKIGKEEVKDRVWVKMAASEFRRGEGEDD